jgi:ribosomal protein L37E
MIAGSRACSTSTRPTHPTITNQTSPHYAEALQVAEGIAAPKGSNVVGWAGLLADQLASGSSAEHLRSYLKKMAKETWDYVNWLTHAKNAGNYDAEIGTAAVSHFLATVTAARLRWGQQGHQRCEACGSYAVVEGQCQRCGWADPDYEPPQMRELPEEELAARLAEPCTPSSDISTLITPDDYQSR